MKNLIGKRYGRLTVIENTGKKAHGKENVYLCKCDCGNTVEVRSGLLSQGRKKSCGCLYRDTRISNMDRLNKAKKYVDGVHVGAFDGRSNKNNTSGFKGVSKHGNGYRAKITVKGVTHYGTTRATKEEAYRDRLKLEEELLPKMRRKNMSLQSKLKWLFGGSGITTYRIAKDTNEKTQTLDIYKNNLDKIKGMSLERAEKLGEYVDNLSLENIYNKKLVNAQIIIANASESEIKQFFVKYNTATTLNWIKPYKDKFIVNFDTYSQKKFRKNDHELYELKDSISVLNHELLQKRAKYIIACGEQINFGGSKTLYKLNGKTYQVVSIINPPTGLRAVDFLRIVETDEWKAEYEPKLDDDFFNQPIDW